MNEGGGTIGGGDREPGGGFCMFCDWPSGEVNEGGGTIGGGYCVPGGPLNVVSGGLGDAGGGLPFVTDVVGAVGAPGTNAAACACGFTGATETPGVKMFVVSTGTTAAGEEGADAGAVAEAMFSIPSRAGTGRAFISAET